MGIAVAGLLLAGRWVVRLLAAPAYFDAYRALPWVALGWAMYGLFHLLVAVGGRAKVTTRNFPAALIGLAANVGLLALLVGPFGIAGAGAALAGAYVVMIIALRLLTRGLFEVNFEWLRLVHFAVIAGGISIAGNLLLPTHGSGGLAMRLLAFALIPLLLWLTRFARPEEVAAARRGRAALAARFSR
jgi:O-antigen/teichoic acid export membrane protein